MAESPKYPLHKDYEGYTHDPRLLTEVVNSKPNPDILKFHWHRYQRNKIAIDRRRNDVEDILAC